MISRLTTTEVMEIFDKAAEKAESMQKEVRDVKQSIERKLTILDSQHEYALNKLKALNDNHGKVARKIVFATTEIVGEYDIFGETVHKKFTKAPRDIFNLKTTRGYFSKDNISKVTVNGVENAAIREAIKQESIEGREFAVEEFSTNRLEIVIEPNLKAPLGSLKMNMIEICPFLPGSFNIENIQLYSKDNLDDPAQELPIGIGAAGARRIVFDEKTDVGKIVISIKLLYKKSNGLFPFGLRHLYFQEANFKENSYAIVRVDKAGYISYILDSVTIRNQNGTGKVSSQEYGIQYYAEYSDGALKLELEPSASASEPNYISINATTCYIKIPITSPLVSMIPNIVIAEAPQEDIGESGDGGGDLWIDKEAIIGTNLGIYIDKTLCDDEDLDGGLQPEETPESDNEDDEDDW